MTKRTSSASWRSSSNTATSSSHASTATVEIRSPEGSWPDRISSMGLTSDACAAARIFSRVCQARIVVSRRTKDELGAEELTAAPTRRCGALMTRSKAEPKFSLSMSCKYART